MKLPVPIALLFALHAGVADAAPRIVYQGTLQGAGEVVMELDSRPAADGTISGRSSMRRLQR